MAYDFTSRPSIGADTYQRLRHDIISGTLAPSSKLRLEDLRRDYGAGLSSLREALARLSVDGFVIAEGQRGFEVAPISQDGLLDIANLRLVIEEHALAQSFQRGDDAWISEVSAAAAALAKYEHRLEQGDMTVIDAWRAADWRFHQTLIDACGSALLIATHAEIFDKYLRYQMIALAYRPSASKAEHSALEQAAIRRDHETGVALLREHIHAGVAHALARTEFLEATRAS